jgi:sterol desaturase/sphingolipid hydroxylase (fatty acid hydroxylase superfamily)
MPATLSTAEFLAGRAVGVTMLAGLFFGLPALVRPHWDAIVARLGGEYHAYPLGIVLTHMMVLLLANAFFLAIYADVLGMGRAFARWKISSKPWPWQAKSAEARAAFRKLVWQSVALTLGNNLLIALPTTYMNFPIAIKYGYRADAASFPSPLTVMWQLACFVAIEATIFYHTHRLLHAVPWLYKRVHKLHHKYYYSLGIAAESAHPVEFLLGNAMPFVAGPLFMGAHLFTMLTWVIYRIGETVDGHSGIDWPGSPFRVLPFSDSATAHDLHHSRNTGNYGSATDLWDRLYGTVIHEDATESDSEVKDAKAGAEASPAPSSGARRSSRIKQQ